MMTTASLSNRYSRVALINLYNEMNPLQIISLLELPTLAVKFRSHTFAASSYLSRLLIVFSYRKECALETCKTDLWIVCEPFIMVTYASSQNSGPMLLQNSLSNSIPSKLAP